MARTWFVSGVLGMLVLLAACGNKSESVPDSLAQAQEGGRIIIGAQGLNPFFECLEQEGITLISAHRGGFYPGLPENSLEAMRFVTNEIPALLEIDVATSRDGVLFLLHDDDLERTTTGRGLAADYDWAELSRLFLKDQSGAITPYHLPKFSEVLQWVEGRAILQVDFKPSTRYGDVIDEVIRQGAGSRVIYIAYTPGQAKALYRLDKKTMISFTIDEMSDFASLAETGIPEKNILAWTGNDMPDENIFDALNSRDVEVIFGTLGGRDSIDKEIARSGNDARYSAIAKMGVDILGTDRPLEAYAALRETGHKMVAPACGVAKG
jgi:glycerophosphoryl diester phosphodiesterase